MLLTEILAPALKFRDGAGRRRAVRPVLLIEVRLHILVPIFILTLHAATSCFNTHATEAR